MKKLIIAFGLCLCVAGAAAAQVVKGGVLYAASKSVALKSSTGFLAGTRGTLSYGDQVTVLEVNGDWVEVQSAAVSSVKGWTASARLTARRIVAGSASSASAREVALAGKGFSREVENAHKAGGKLNYADVDRTEAETVPEQELYNFLKDGHLSLGEP
jgi:hypothetical protein